MAEQLGADLACILRYFAEDGMKSAKAIEQAMHGRISVALSVPAHTPKGEALQIGARSLSLIAEKLEMSARHLVEIQQMPEEFLPVAAVCARFSSLPTRSYSAGALSESGKWPIGSSAGSKRGLQPSSADSDCS